jgi:hypothetical protein
MVKFAYPKYTGTDILKPDEISGILFLKLLFAKRAF